jgi:3-oxoacyl-[acyl-carrier-protein] synthase II
LVILESLEHAQKRQARIYGEVVGYAMTSDAHHITSPALDGDGAYRVMKLTLEDGQIPLEEVDLINAHGTSTPLGDKIEMAAIRRLFGSHADRLWIHSSKSMVGHLLGAAGGFEAVVALKALHSSQVHPTRNVDHQDPDCPLDVVPQVGREKKLKVVLSNSFGFGGTNAALAFRSL